MKRLRFAFGPEASAFGSWEWIGADLSRELDRQGYETTTFRNTVPDCDVAVFVKFKPSAEDLTALRKTNRFLVYCPVDLYDSAVSIDADAESLQQFDLIVVHCHRLRKYFTTYAAVEYLDHHLKFIAPPSTLPQITGPLLWIGNRSNLPPVINWVNHHQLPGELWILTDFPGNSAVQSPDALGLHEGNSIRIERWTPARHIEWKTHSRAALDVKGDDFRARHKPPTKALEFLASGLPLAMNSDSSSTEHLISQYGFSISGLDDRDRWLSTDYWKEIQQLVPRLNAELSLPMIAQRFLQMLRA